MENNKFKDLVILNYMIILSLYAIYPHLIDFSPIDVYEVKVVKILKTGCLQVKKVGGWWNIISSDKYTTYEVCFRHVKIEHSRIKSKSNLNLREELINYLKKDLEGESVILKYMEVAPWGKLVAHVWKNHEHINYKLIYLGMAVLNPQGMVPNQKIKRQMIKAQILAMQRKLGFWHR